MVRMSSPSNLGASGSGPFFGLFGGADPQGLDGLAAQLNGTMQSKDQAMLAQALQQLAKLPLEDILALLVMLNPELRAALGEAMSKGSFGGGGGAPAGGAAPSGGGGGGAGGGAGRAQGGGGGGGGRTGPSTSPGAATRSNAGVQGTPNLTQAKNLSPEQKRNAQIIIEEGKKMGASPRDIQIALMTAMQESTLKNLNYGDRDSVGLFQQRPSCGWGTVAQCTDPRYASQQFYKHLLANKNRDSMSLTQAAQAVQRSAYPDAYAKWEGLAAGIMQDLGTVA
jgi:hypothetical protein